MEPTTIKALEKRVAALEKGMAHPVKPHIVDQELDDAYKRMAADEAREAEAHEWAEGTLGDVADETR